MDRSDPGGAEISTRAHRALYPHDPARGHNFELVAQDGTRTPFSTIEGFTEEVKIATVRSGPHQGGFTVGELFTGTGVPGVIARISANGSTVDNPWVTLPGESGLLRGSLFQDRYGVFDGDLIVVTTHGGVWRVPSAGKPTRLAQLGVHLEGVTTVPDVPDRYGPWAGKILVGAEQQGLLHTVDIEGATESFELGIAPEDIEIIPKGEHFFGVDFGHGTLWGAEASAFKGMVGDFLIPDELTGILWHVRWDPTAGKFRTENVAQKGSWEHVTFSSAGIGPVGGLVMWINHLDLLAGDPSVHTSHNAISSEVGGGLAGLVVHSKTLGENAKNGGNKQVWCALEVPPGYSVTGVRVCYELSSSASFISQIRLAQVQNPPASAIVQLDDPTDWTNPGPICVDSAATSIDPGAGPLLLSLRVNFGNTHDRIAIRGVALHLQQNTSPAH